MIEALLGMICGWVLGEKATLPAQVPRKAYATPAMQRRMDAFCMEKFLDLACYLEPMTVEWFDWVGRTAIYRSKTRAERMDVLCVEVAILVVKQKGPENTSVHTLAQSLGSEFEPHGHRCYVDGMMRTWEQAKEHLVAVWRLSNELLNKQ